jgi:diguanylate cyclase (GGDEF)-like protein
LSEEIVMSQQRKPMVFVKSGPVRRFAVQIGLVLLVFTTAVFVGIFMRTEALVRDITAAQAVSYIDLIVDARFWNSSHGGVWVVKGGSVQSNPYLRALGVDPDTATVAGQMLTLRNPAAMTNEISRITEGRDGVTFRLTSLKPVNPADAPDEWERGVLQGFGGDLSPVTRIERRGRKNVFRMMRPLLVDQTCLRCHASQGYKVGDVRGAISASVPMAAADAALRRNAAILLGLYALVLFVGGAGALWLVARLGAKIDQSEATLTRIAATDELTRVGNRRAIMERLESELARGSRQNSPTAVIECDVDLFKRVNDSLGHAAGDAVLREIAQRVLGGLRTYDSLGRIGGEEFLVVAPNCDLESALALAERLRAAVADEPIDAGGTSLDVTISLGASASVANDTADTIIARADAALYSAKEHGRNRVEPS